MAHVGFGLVVLAILVFVITRDDSVPTETGATDVTASTRVATTRPSEASTTSIAAATTTAAPVPTPTSGVTTTVTTAPVDLPVTLDPEAASYLDSLARFGETVEEMASEMTAASEAWDNRLESGAGYRETASVFVDVMDRASDLGARVSDQPVPEALRDVHEGTDGPVEQAAKLAPAAEAVLAGLRIPAPDDGSRRRAAVADFNAAAAEFGRMVGEVATYVDENAEALGLTADPASPPTTAAPDELSDATVVYLDGLLGFKADLTNLVEEMASAGEAWDDRAATGATYGDTASTFERVIGQVHVLYRRIEEHPIPEPVAALGERLVEQAARLAPSAEAILDGLRIPAPEDGSQRRAALADFRRAADAFYQSIEDLARYVDQNADALGLTSGDI